MNPDPKARRHVACRAAERFHAEAHAPVPPAFQYVLEKIRESRPYGCALRRLVQLRPDAKDPENVAAMASGLSDHLWEMDDIVGAD